MAAAALPWRRGSVLIRSLSFSPCRFLAWTPPATGRRLRWSHISGGMARTHHAALLYCPRKAGGTMAADSKHLITTIEGLEKIYGEVYPPAKAKETDRITPAYRKLIEAAPFFALASNGPGGLDCASPTRRRC
jgi:hypothetical protein